MVSARVTIFKGVQICRFTTSKYFFIGLNILVLTMLYAYINSFLFTKGFASQILMFLGEKALLFFQGNSAQIENFIFVYPSIPYLFFLLLRNPFVTVAAAGGITVSIFLYYLWENFYIKKKMPLTFFFCVIYLCASPLSIYMYSENITSCLLVFFIFLCLHFFYSFYKDQLIINLFLFGILSSTIFFINFEISLIIAIWGLSVLIASKKILKESLISALFVTFFPLIFFSLGWLYINWLHTDDLFYFFRNWQAATFDQEYNIKFLYHKSVFKNYFIWLSEIFFKNFLFIFPSAFLVLLIIVVKKFRNFILLQILIFPYLLLITDFFWGKFLIKHGNHFFLLFIGTSIFVFIHHSRFTLYPIVKRLYLIFIFLSYCLSLWIPFYTGSMEEKHFMRSLIGYHSFEKLYEEKKLMKKIQDDGKILLDDSVLYPVVFYSNKPQRFILPHQSEFKLALEKPELFVEYIIISNNGKKDILSSHYGFNYTPDIRNFDLIEQYDNLLLYKISDKRMVNRVLND